MLSHPHDIGTHTPTTTFLPLFLKKEIHIEGGNHEERILVGRQTEAFGELKEIMDAPVPLSKITLYTRTTMPPSLTPELLDLIVDHLHDESTTLQSSYLVSKSWIPRTRKHFFQHRIPYRKLPPPIMDEDRSGSLKLSCPLHPQPLDLQTPDSCERLKYANLDLRLSTPRTSGDQRNLAQSRRSRHLCPLTRDFTHPSISRLNRCCLSTLRGLRSYLLLPLSRRLGIDISHRLLRRAKRDVDHPPDLTKTHRGPSS